jgi:hypothetical protein
VDYSGHATIDIIHPHEAKAQEDSLMATDWFTRKEVSTWPKLYDCLEKYLEEKKAQWVFRGQENEEWELRD